MSKEFRNVTAARELLAQYIESGRNIDLIENLNINQVSRYDVWMCVFEGEKEAYKVLERKELYNTLFEMQTDTSSALLKIAAMICINYISRAYEFKTPLSPLEIVNICEDFFGKPLLQAMSDCAKEALSRRIEIAGKYKQTDTEWVQYSRDTLNIIEKAIKP